MPELPEVETIRRGLAPQLVGARVANVLMRRPDLRFPFPLGLGKNLEGRTISAVGRRAKYLLFELDNGGVMLSHLGMTGNYRIARGQGPKGDDRLKETGFAEEGFGKHDHFVLALERAGDRFDLIYSDPRRFGFIDWSEKGAQSRFLNGLGPEPLGNQSHAPALARALAGRSGPIKTVLLDQRVIAGLGNIYVCEALWRARIWPKTPGSALVRADGRPSASLERLTGAIRSVLSDALAAGGSTLRDYRDAAGETGYFQHSFDVYAREGEPCRRPGCHGEIVRFVQSGRSSFACPVCQRK